MPRTTKPSLKICWVDGFSEVKPEPQIQALRDLGHTVTIECDETYDIIFCASIYRENVARGIKHRYHQAKLVNYCWDFYQWAWEGKHDLGWHRYHMFLKDSDLVLVPSKAQQKRLLEFGVPSEVVLTSVEYEDHPTFNGGYVLDHMRYYPEGNRDWVVKACDELGIPCNHSEHKYSNLEWKDVVANCSFMACGYREASTGGLTLIEGLWNGKPALISDSPYMGGRDYLGDFGFYFKHDDYEDLKRMLITMFTKPPKIDIIKARKYIRENFSHKVMAKRLEEVLCDLKLR